MHYSIKHNCTIFKPCDLKLSEHIRRSNLVYPNLGWTSSHSSDIWTIPFDKLLPKSCDLFVRCCVWRSWLFSKKMAKSQLSIGSTDAPSGDQWQNCNFFTQWLCTLNITSILCELSSVYCIHFIMWTIIIFENTYFQDALYLNRYSNTMCVYICVYSAEYLFIIKSITKKCLF